MQPARRANVSIQGCVSDSWKWSRAQREVSHFFYCLEINTGWTHWDGTGLASQFPSGKREQENEREIKHCLCTHSALEGAASARLCSVIKGESERADFKQKEETKHVFIHLIPPQDAMNMQPISERKKNGPEELLAS